jgi:hypothetical protein
VQKQLAISNGSLIAGVLETKEQDEAEIAQEACEVRGRRICPGSLNLVANVLNLLPGKFA